MKAVISQPMKGKSVEQIKQERADLAELLSKKGYIVEDRIFNFTDDLSEDLHALFCLGRVISLIAAMDTVVFMDGWEEDRGCRIEHTCCKEYGVPILYTKDL